MKRLFILTMVLSVYLLTNCPSFSIQTKSSDYQIVNDNSITDEKDENYNIIQETDRLLFIEKNKKFGIIDKAAGNFILEPVADAIIPFKENNETEYKIKIKDNIGYLNTDKKIIFISSYDDMYLLDNYIKVKKNNKYGFFNKEGNLVLKPIFDDAGIVKAGDIVYLTGKYNGEVKYFDENGKYIPENELYTIKNDYANILVRDLKPIIKKFRRSNAALYKADSSINDKQLEIDNIKLKDKTQIASVEKNIEKPAEELSKNTILRIKNKNYILVDNNGKIGLNKENGKEVIPAVYNTIDAMKLCKRFCSPVIVANKENSYSIYNLKGKLLAEEVYNKINVYKYGKVYSYNFEDGVWILRENNKIIGYITINDDGSYEFVKTKFHIRSLHKINELLITLLSVS